MLSGRWLSLLRITLSARNCKFLAARTDLREVFATNLRRLRHAKGLSQDDLAYEADVSRSYLSQLEKGAFYASLKVIAKLAAVLDVEPAELLKAPLKQSPRGKHR
jgi:transcriptional regulator with XRE-family HTH domain